MHIVVFFISFVEVARVCGLNCHKSKSVTVDRIQLIQGILYCRLNGENEKNVPFKKKKIQYFAQFSKLIKEMPLF